MATGDWIALGISAVMMIVAVITLARNGKHDVTDEAVQRASMTADLKYIRTSVDDIKLENRSMQRDVGELKLRVTEIDASVRSAHKRLDDLQKG